VAQFNDDGTMNWLPLVQGGAPAQAAAGGAWQLDTTGAGVVIAGAGRISPLPLDTAAGFDLTFALAVDSEAHTSANRAGYSVVVVGADPTRSLELAFWSGNVWAHDYVASDPDRFVHGLDAAHDTAPLQTYRLAVRSQGYTLSVGGATLLTGSLHDYTPGGAPYTQPNFIFFGDDTSRGTSVTRLAQVTLTAVPEPAPAALLAAGLAALAWRGRAQRGTGRGCPRPSMAT